MKGIEDEVIISFIKENQNKFYKVAYSYVKNSDEALDIIQEAIVKAMQNRHSLKQQEYLKTWFYRILINECLMYLRKNKKILYFENVEEYFLESNESKDKDENLDLYSAIDKLPNDLKTIVLLRFFEEMKFDEIAKIINLNINTVKSKLYKALGVLRIDMEGNIDD